MTATLDETADAPSDPDATVPHPVPAALQPWDDRYRLRGWIATAVVVGFAAITRLWAIGFPGGKSFDEVYYATEAQELLRYGYEDNRGYMFIVHPPLGKWLIAGTSWLVTVFTDKSLDEQLQANTVGWRLACGIAGIVLVLLVTRVARRMFRSTVFGVIAGGLLAMDGLTLVLSRTAILDIFLELFIFAAFGALVIDRDTVRRRLARLVATGTDLSWSVPALGPRPWRLVAGVMFGAALAVKWSALYFLPALWMLTLAWDRGALRAAGCRVPWRWVARRSLLPSLGPMLLAPVGTYLLTYLGWFTGENSWGRHWAEAHPDPWGHVFLPFGVNIPFWWGWLPASIRSLGAYTLDAYRFHAQLGSGHAYESEPWAWLVDGRPVDFYYNGDETTCGGASCAREVLLLGTPLLWWAFLPALLWLLWHWWSTRDWRAASVLVLFVFGWAIWLLYPDRTKFFFYMAPLVPFLVLGLTHALAVMVGSREATQRRWAWGLGGVSLYLGLVIACFWFFWPVFTGGLLTYDQWQLRMWLPSWV